MYFSLPVEDKTRRQTEKEETKVQEAFNTLDVNGDMV